MFCVWYIVMLLTCFLYLNCKYCCHNFSKDFYVPSCYVEKKEPKTKAEKSLLLFLYY